MEVFDFYVGKLLWEFDLFSVENRPGFTIFA